MNYIGSKHSLLDFLHDTISEVTGFKEGDEFTFADLFAGTGAVGTSYRKKGCNVISNDIQYYSYVLNRHYIENSLSPDNELLEYMNTLKGIKGFIYNNYCSGSGSGRNYFTDSNGMRCDAMRSELERLYREKKIDSSVYFHFLASIINSIDKYANTASVYGAFLKHTKKSAERNFRLELLPVINGKKGKAYNENISTLIKKISGDVLYLDPPYNARQYSANYHVLETIAKYDNPVLHGKTGLRDYTNQKSEFCSSKTAENVFRNLIADADFKYIFLSYNNEGIMPLEAIKKIMSEFGEYQCYTKQYRRFKADKNENRNIKSDSTVEYLHCLIK